MKNRDGGIKKTIRKRIDISKQRNKMNERDKLRTGSIPAKPIPVGLSRNEMRRGVESKEPTIFKEYGKYLKEIGVDFDFIFCVSSFERYEKIYRILKQLFSQKTKYSFKFILVNDGSKDIRYDDLEYLFPDIFYIKNKVGGGKVNYWKTVNLMWKKASEFKSYGIIQLDDDFILCDEFLNKLLNKFFEIKESSNNYMVFGFHLYNFGKESLIESFWFNENKMVIDGGMLIDTQFLKLINYKLDKIEKRVTPKTSSYVWVRLRERMIEFGVKIYRFENSLVWHDGNDDSKLHPNVRKIKRVYTKNFIDKDINYEQ
jgi:hypothetical protein